MTYFVDFLVKVIFPFHNYNYSYYPNYYYSPNEVYVSSGLTTPILPEIVTGSPFHEAFVPEINIMNYDGSLGIPYNVGSMDIADSTSALESNSENQVGRQRSASLVQPVNISVTPLQQNDIINQRPLSYQPIPTYTLNQTGVYPQVSLAPIIAVTPPQPKDNVGTKVEKEEEKIKETKVEQKNEKQKNEETKVEE